MNHHQRSFNMLPPLQNFEGKTPAFVENVLTFHILIPVSVVRRCNILDAEALSGSELKKEKGHRLKGNVMSL